MSGTVSIKDGNLIFELHGIDKILATKSSISVALKHVVSVSTEKVNWKPFEQLRIGGTSIPGIVKDGRYLSSDGVMFYEMHNPDKCISVSLADETYKKIIFEVDDKESIAKMITNAISSGREHS
jgi:hypothetical protein